MDELWLVSYPKSGNTWLRFVAFYLLMRRLPETSAELDALTGSWKARGAKARSIRKSHALRNVLEAEMSPGSAVIYLHRHPLGVMQSALNYAVLTGEIPPGDKAARDAWVVAYTANRGNPSWFGARNAAGTWTANVEGWLAPRPWPSLVLSYDACLRDEVAMVRRIAKFLRVDRSDDFVTKCASLTTFSALKAFEQDEVDRAAEAGAPQGRFTVTTRKSGIEAGHRFFSSGRADSYRDVFGADELRAAWKAFRDTAKPLGYRL